MIAHPPASELATPRPPLTASQRPPGQRPIAQCGEPRPASMTTDFHDPEVSQGRKDEKASFRLEGVLPPPHKSISLKPRITVEVVQESMDSRTAGQPQPATPDMYIQPVTLNNPQDLKRHHTAHPRTPDFRLAERTHHRRRTKSPVASTP